MYAPRPPRTLTETETALLLKKTGEHRDGFRDHVILSLALGTGLREHEIVALTVGDIVRPDNGVRRRVTLKTYKRSSKEPSAQEVFLPDTLHYKLTKFIAWKEAQGESILPDAPLFVSKFSRSKGSKLSTRGVRWLFRRWQGLAGLDRTFNFHSLRHTALTNAYRKTKDVVLVQRVARHKSVTTTQIYVTPSDEDVLRAVRELTC